MDVWRLVIYAVATLLALRVLFGLMAAHRAQVLGGLIGQEQARRKAIADAAKAKRAKEEAAARALPAFARRKTG